MINIGYHLARLQGCVRRALYLAAISVAPPRSRAAMATHLPFDVYSYSGEAALPEQVASIRSFLRFAGVPRKFVIVSDGTYSQRSISLLEKLDPVVSVERAAGWIPDGIDERLLAYLTDHPTGKQLALIMSLPLDVPAFYVDSDVLFFEGARQLASALARDPEAPALYQADCKLSADERLLRDASERNQPVNTGVLFLRRKLDWSLSISRFLELDGAPNFFTNQTMTHLAMHVNNARAFDREKFVLQLDDQFVYPDRYAKRELVLRHYVNPVRHKFWCSLS